MKKTLLKLTALVLAALFVVSAAPKTAYAKSSDLCAKSGCNSKKYCGSYCAKHDSCKIKSACKTANYGGRKICKQSGCGNTANSSGYCSRHDSSYDYNTCAESGCKNKKNCGSYCSVHDKCKIKNGCKNQSIKKTYSNSSSKKKSSYDSYDKGYEDIWLDDDYDDDRYEWDDDYALGVDDAMEDEDW